jgi:hypothetical protein
MEEVSVQYERLRNQNKEDKEERNDNVKAGVCTISLRGKAAVRGGE